MVSSVDRLAVLAWHLAAGKARGAGGGGGSRTARVGDTVTVRVAGCGYNRHDSHSSSSNALTFQPLEEEDGAVIADFFENDTTSFVCGPGSAAGALQPALSATVVGMAQGESKQLIIRSVSW